MNELKAPEPKVFDFEGTKLTAYPFQGQYVFLAREVCTALGYTAATKLGDLIRTKWANEFVEGKDFVLVEGEALAELKSRLTTQQGVSEPDRSPRLLLITKEGVNLACLKTRKTLGIKMRRWLASDVLPSLEATGKYETQPQVATDLSTNQPSHIVNQAFIQLFTSMDLVQTQQAALQATQEAQAAELEAFKTSHARAIDAVEVTQAFAERVRMLEGDTFNRRFERLQLEVTKIKQHLPAQPGRALPKGYHTIQSYAEATNVRLSPSEARGLGRQASHASRKQGLLIMHPQDPRWGAVGAYTIAILEAVFGPWSLHGSHRVGSSSRDH